MKQEQQRQKKLRTNVKNSKKKDRDTHKSKRIKRK